MTAGKLESYGLKVPFALSGAFIQFEKGCSTKDLIGAVEELDFRGDQGAIQNVLFYRLLRTENGVAFGVVFSSDEPALKFKIALSVEIFDVDTQLIYASKLGEAK